MLFLLCINFKLKREWKNTLFFCYPFTSYKNNIYIIAFEKILLIYQIALRNFELQAFIIRYLNIKKSAKFAVLFL